MDVSGCPDRPSAPSRNRHYFKSPSVRTAWLLVALTTLWLLPLLTTLGADDEGYLNIVSTTVERARGLRQGIFPLWTSRLGFGTPLPFATDLSFHPLMPLFGSGSVPWAIRIFFWLHFVTGVLCFFHLGRKMGINLPACFVGSLTYLCASPGVNYVFTDFWMDSVLMYTLAPAILLCLELLFRAESKAHSLKSSLSLALVCSLVTLNGHPGISVPYLMVLGIYALCRWKAVREKWLYLLATGCVVAIATVGRIVTFFLEYARFNITETPLTFHPPGHVDLASLFLGRAAPLFNRPLPGARTVFMGLPFLLCALAGMVYRRGPKTYRWSLAIAAAASSLMVFLPSPFFGPIAHFVSWPFVTRDMAIIFAVLLAGLFLTGLFHNERKPIRKAAGAVLVLQSVSVVIGMVPYWSRLLDSPRPMKDLFHPSPLIASARRLQKERPGRILFSPDIYRRSRISLAHLGLELNMLPYYDLWEVNAWLKGISYAEFYPNRKMMYGGIREAPEAIVNQTLLDVFNIRQVIAYENEAVAPRLRRVETYRNRSDGSVYLYENPEAWPRAYFADPAVQTIRLARLPQAGHDRLLAADASPVLALRKEAPPPRILKDGFGRTDLSFAPAEQDRCLVVTEYYRPAWRARIHFKDGRKIRQKVSPALEHLISVNVPAGADMVQLFYRPVGAMISMAASWIILLSLIFGRVFLGWRIKRHRQKSKETEEGEAGRPRFVR